MEESQVELNTNRIHTLDKFESLLPDLTEAVDGLRAVYTDGALSGKIKRLMALAMALGVGCRNCILSQTMNALEKGASKEEIVETISVAVSMRGTTGMGESLRVIQLLDELGKL
jgi:AhpD family alkylhydroperoxidase